MSQEIYELIPGSIASVIYVRPPGCTEEPVACVFMSKERGVVVCRYDKPLAQYGWPIEVQEHIHKYFDRVFSLEHENWMARGPSPRSRYCSAAVPWKVEVAKEST